LRLRVTSRKRAGLSEQVGALLLIAITVISGAAVFGYVNSQARVSELNYANSVGNTNNFLAENMKVIDMYFATTSQIGIWVYNTGSTTFAPFSVRLYDSAGLINVLFNYTGTAVKTDRVFDLKANAANFHSTCRAVGSTYESPTLSTTSTKVQNAQLLLLTIPPTTTNCPSYGQLFNTGTAYSVVVTGVFGNTVTFYQLK
jgi:archaellum component FlaF (FlaF/FlaG flagellin family)